MKPLKFLIPVIASFSLLACQGQKTEVVKQYYGNTNESGYQQQEGGTHSGGGDNGVDGKGLEDYWFDVQADAVYQQFVLPIILKVAQTHPRFASDMVHISSERKWYQIPVALNRLRASDIGVSFSDKDLQQLALQNLKAVWINSNQFAKMPSDESRGRLILHEILMGIRLMKLKSSLDECYSSIALLELDPKRLLEYRKAREQCAVKYMFDSQDTTIIPGVTKGFDLTGDDYDNIRELGLELWNNKGEISKAELDAWLKVNKFRSY